MNLLDHLELVQRVLKVSFLLKETHLVQLVMSHAMTVLNQALNVCLVP